MRKRRHVDNSADPFNEIFEKLDIYIQRLFPERGPRITFYVVTFVVFVLLIGFGIYYEKHKPPELPANHTRVYVKNRFHTIDALVQTYTKMHLDDAVTEAYRESRELVRKINPDRDADLPTLGKLYYAASRVLLASTYLPIMLYGVSEPGALMYMHRSDLPSGFQISSDFEGDSIPILVPLFVRQILQNDLREHYDQMSEYEDAQDFDQMLLQVPRLQKDFLDGLLFYIRSNHLIPTSLVDSLAYSGMHAEIQNALQDSTISTMNRFLRATIFYEKHLFNILTSMYVEYSLAADQKPDQDHIINLALRMDKGLEFQGRVKQVTVFKRLAEASGVIDEMMMLTLDALNQVKERNE